jgi:hypothetical protein
MTLVLKDVTGYHGNYDILDEPVMTVESSATNAEIIRFAPGLTGNRYQRFQGMLVMPYNADVEPAFIFKAENGSWDVYASGYLFQGVSPFE